MDNWKKIQIDDETMFKNSNIVPSIIVVIECPIPHELPIFQGASYFFSLANVDTVTMWSISKECPIPIKTPIIMANANPLRISPPRIKIENRANNVVIEVIIVLDKVSFIETLVKSKISTLVNFLRFSLTLS